jgi:saccharopepsin
VANQALLDVSSSLNPALSYGADGVLGLGFTSLSTIDHVVNASGGSSGRSLLYNLFQDNPSEPNFVAFSLQRSTEPGDTVTGNFSIGRTLGQLHSETFKINFFVFTGEYEPAYAAVANSTAIPTWPVNSPKRWNVLLDALILTDQTITPSTQVPDVPGNRAVALLDSGTSYTLVLCLN